MEIDFDINTGVPQISLSESDRADARAIQKMMSSAGWKVLAKYMVVGRESIIDAGKEGIRTRGKVDLSPQKWAVLKGWDEAARLAERIVARAEEFKPEEADNGQDDDD